MSLISLNLEPLDSTDIGLARSWRNSWAVWRWCRQDDLISDVEQVRWFNRQSEDRTIRMYKIVAEMPTKDDAEKTTRGPIGVCGFTSIDFLHRRAEFSLYLAPEMQGKGIGPLALNLLLQHGFTNLGFNLVWGETFDENPAAKVFEKLGFVKEGTRREFYWKDGKFIDAHIYSIKGDEWRARFAASTSGDTSGPARDASRRPDGANPKDRIFGASASPAPASVEHASGVS